jgi:SAM-dependent methyltransferase
MGCSPSVVRLIGSPQPDGEYVVLRGVGVDEETVRLHDYPRLYAVPGLYEYVVQELLGCRSPQVAADGLSHELERLGLDPAGVPILDLGAGTGLVGELIRGLGATTVIGLDALDAARDACLRDRPGIYHDYLVGDLARPRPGLFERLRAYRPGGLVSAGALGGTHAPADALVNALALLPAGAPVVFTIDERWTQSDGPGGFRTPISRLLASGQLRLVERSRFQHRRSTAGTPIHYEMFIAAKGPAPAPQ